ncbi:hypothetical protein MBM_00687 [Drepanopeziza brunnea f. sp. 'multigermtubi' MB_m1]|uniref:Uncharacterized protein n=1 Tax=Marssonina brunnea f. sp. multigermtubi (strain MB_m1) TaxID=1072389 RepID=K1Y8V5_MARBU|nr:uncharacterized protein MBM_00687 [Drepanopeziza brunnea f. sp. 'multigermtubi' MB_m1]EKD21574.1 hypothetical protein MBM_00687 [Drepanopeziza brunnea f. sp. 'multigermtubi' MB_m1]
MPLLFSPLFLPLRSLFKNEVKLNETPEISRAVDAVHSSIQRRIEGRSTKTQVQVQEPARSPPATRETKEKDSPTAITTLLLKDRHHHNHQHSPEKTPLRASTKRKRSSRREKRPKRPPYSQEKGPRTFPKIPTRSARSLLQHHGDSARHQTSSTRPHPAQAARGADKVGRQGSRRAAGVPGWCCSSRRNVDIDIRGGRARNGGGDDGARRSRGDGRAGHVRGDGGDDFGDGDGLSEARGGNDGRRRGGSRSRSDDDDDDDEDDDEDEPKIPKEKRLCQRSLNPRWICFSRCPSRPPLSALRAPHAPRAPTPMPPIPPNAPNALPPPPTRQRPSHRNLKFRLQNFPLQKPISSSIPVAAPGARVSHGPVECPWSARVLARGKVHGPSGKCNKSVGRCDGRTVEQSNSRTVEQSDDGIDDMQGCLGCGLEEANRDLDAPIDLQQEKMQVNARERWRERAAGSHSHATIDSLAVSSRASHASSASHSHHPRAHRPRPANERARKDADGGQ